MESYIFVFEPACFFFLTTGKKREFRFHPIKEAVVEEPVDITPFLDQLDESLKDKVLLLQKGRLVQSSAGLFCTQESGCVVTYQFVQPQSRGIPACANEPVMWCCRRPA